MIFAADQNNLIFPLSFGFQQGFIGSFEKLLDRCAVVGEGGKSAADGQSSLSLRPEDCQAGSRNLSPKPFRHKQRLTGMFGRMLPTFFRLTGFRRRSLLFRQVPEDHGKLISTDTGNDIVCSAAPADQLARLKQDLIPDRMAELIVVLLEIVNIEQQKGYRELVLSGKSQHLGKKLVQITPVFQARQVILCCQFFKQADSFQVLFFPFPG